MQRFVILFAILGIVGAGAFLGQRKGPVVTPRVVKQPSVTVTPSPAAKLLPPVPVLMYHYVETVQDPRDTMRKALDINPTIFDRQVQTLMHAGYAFVTMADVANAASGKGTLPEKSVVLTFDDGYRDFYTNVFPILRKYGVKVTIYVIPGFLDKPNYMRSAQITELRDSGLVDIGAHTVDHPSLKGKPAAFVEREVTESKSMLEKQFGISVVSFAYPYGQYDTQAVAAVRKAGFTSAVTTQPGIVRPDPDMFLLPRIRPGLRTDSALILRITR